MDDRRIATPPESPRQEESEAEDEEVFLVEKILDCRTVEGKRQYKVRWVGYSEDDDTWEPEKNLMEDCPELVNEFLQHRQKQKPARKKTRGRPKRSLPAPEPQQSSAYTASSSEDPETDTSGAVGEKKKAEFFRSMFAQGEELTGEQMGLGLDVGDTVKMRGRAAREKAEQKLAEQISGLSVRSPAISTPIGPSTSSRLQIHKSQLRSPISTPRSTKLIPPQPAFGTSREALLPSPPISNTATISPMIRPATQTLPEYAASLVTCSSPSVGSSSVVAASTPAVQNTTPIQVRADVTTTPQAAQGQPKPAQTLPPKPTPPKLYTLDVPLGKPLYEMAGDIDIMDSKYDPDKDDPPISEHYSSLGELGVRQWRYYLAKSKGLIENAKDGFDRSFPINWTVQARLLLGHLPVFSGINTPAERTVRECFPTTGPRHPLTNAELKRAVISKDLSRLHGWSESHKNDLEQADVNGKTLLMRACKQLSVEGPNARGSHLECINVLICAGADVCARDMNGNAAIMTAVSKRSEPLLVLLLRHGADPNIRLHWGKETPLMRAAKLGNLPMVKVLVEYGACDLSLVNHLGQTAAQVAGSAGHTEIQDYLTQRASAYVVC